MKRQHGTDSPIAAKMAMETESLDAWLSGEPRDAAFFGLDRSSPPVRLSGDFRSPRDTWFRRLRFRLARWLTSGEYE